MEAESPEAVITSAAPGVDVADLAARVRQRAAGVRARPEGRTLDALGLRSSIFVDSLEAHANIADHKHRIRTQWPSNLGARFPFGLTAVRRLALGGLAFLFKDQHHVNAALVAAFRDQISLNRHLIEQLRVMHENVERMASRTPD